MANEKIRSMQQYAYREHDETTSAKKVTIVAGEAGIGEVTLGTGTNTVGKAKLTDGTEDMAVDTNNNGMVSMGTKLAGEDLTNDVLKNDPATYSYSYISSATTTTVKSGAGRLHAVVISETAAGAVTIYDNTEASGTVIAVLKASIAEGTYVFDVAFATGLTIVTAAASKLTVSYR